MAAHPDGNLPGDRSSDFEQRFFDLSIDMLCVLAFTGYFKRLNDAWESTLGFTRAELMSKPFIDFVHPDDRERTLGQNREVRGGERARLFEDRYVALRSFLPICSYCKSIRDDENYWQSVEAYISKHTNTQFSHSVCPACHASRVEPEFHNGVFGDDGDPP